MPNGMPTIKNKQIKITTDKPVFFVSDHHFGLDTEWTSLEREKIFVNWLDDVKNHAGAIFILGDLFDVWYEYKTAVPKGFVRVLGKLAELTDNGIPVYFFTGNHDMWMLDYFEKELNIPVYFNPVEATINDKNFLLGHGDGLGPGDKKYKLLKKLFTNKIAQWAFRWLHPDLGLRLAQYLSRENKAISGEYDQKFLGEANEWLYLYSKEYLKKNPHIDFFVFGHRHLPLQMKLNDKSFYYNSGDWLHHFTYLEFENAKLSLKKFK